jgi:PPM family protein phosphatase
VRRGRRRLTSILVAVGIIAVLVLVPLWIATRAVFFVGTDDQGFVTVYQGVPYDLGGGVRLYSEQYVSGLPAGTLSRRDRGTVTDHAWRSRDDALKVVRTLERRERGPLAPASGASGAGPGS